jgi:hypothetical protein
MENNSNIEEINNEPQKRNEVLERLTQDGWEDTLSSLGHLKIYKRGDERVLYNPKNQSIYNRYITKRKQQ